MKNNALKNKQASIYQTHTHTHIQSSTHTEKDKDTNYLASFDLELFLSEASAPVPRPLPKRQTPTDTYNTPTFNIYISKLAIYTNVHLNAKYPKRYALFMMVNSAKCCHTYPKPCVI